MSRCPGQDGEELDNNEDMFDEWQLRRWLENTKFTPCNIFTDHSFVCILLGLFGHVGDFPQVPKCSLPKSILSKIQDKRISKGIPSVGGFRLSYILLHHLSPQEVDLRSSVCVRQFPYRLIRGRCGRHCVFSMSVVDGDSKW